MSLVRTWPQSKAPRRRVGAEAWTILRVGEGASSTGAFTVIDTQAWTDPNPAAPLPVDIETENATLENGWYRFQWEDATGDTSEWSYPIYKSGMEVEMVAALVRSRTRDKLGNELGVFTDQTRPTAQQVIDLYTAEAAMVSLTTGQLEVLTCDSVDAIRRGAMQVIAKRVAAIIEASFRPDELAQGRTVADFYQGDGDADLAALTAAADRCRAETPGDEGGGGADMAPIGYFPPSCRVVI